MLKRHNKIGQFPMIAMAFRAVKNSKRQFFTLSALFAENVPSASAAKFHTMTALGAERIFFTENIVDLVLDKLGKM
jgi:hypothetical protein